MSIEWTGRPYQTRRAALLLLERELVNLGVPCTIQENCPQTASSFPGDHWQPCLFAGDDEHGFKSVKYLYGNDGWRYVIDTWMNPRGNDVAQVAGEILIWWVEQQKHVRM